MKGEFQEYIEMINEIDLDLVILKNKLIPIFLHNVPKEVLDISYSLEERHLKFQIVLLEGYDQYNSNFVLKNLNDTFENYTIELSFVYQTKDDFNLSKDSWAPVKYTRLENWLLSKAEI